MSFWLASLLALVLLALLFSLGLWWGRRKKPHNKKSPDAQHRSSLFVFIRPGSP